MRLFWILLIVSTTLVVVAGADTTAKPSKMSLTGHLDEGRYLRSYTTDVSTQEERGKLADVVSKYVNRAAHSLLDTICKVLYKLGSTPTALAERLRIGEPGTSKFYIVLFEKYEALYAARSVK